jgi:hypothetical protein
MIDFMNLSCFCENQDFGTVFVERFLNMLGMYCFQMFSSIYNLKTTIDRQLIVFSTVKTVLEPIFHHSPRYR